MASILVPDVQYTVLVLSGTYSEVSDTSFLQNLYSSIPRIDTRQEFYQTNGLESAP
jgi:hypothetical protein